MTIKEIFDEIANESGTNMKMEILEKYKDNELLVKVLYLANSKRVKFYIKQIPEYSTADHYELVPLEHAVDALEKLSSRELTGHAGIEHLKDILSHLNYDDAYIIERIIEKDCKIGMGTRNINKVIPNLIEKTGYMGCKPYSRKLIDKLLEAGACYSQEKMDGRYVNIIISNGKVSMESRQGEPTILENPAFLKELEKFPAGVINAELTMDGVERYESNGIISSLISIANKRAEGDDVTKSIKKLETKHMPYQQALDSVRVTAWDVLTIEDYETRTCTRPYCDRFNALSDYVNLLQPKMISVVETKMVHTVEEVMAHFTEVVGRGGEGTVVKSTDGVWADKKPNYQIKVKKEMELDLQVIGFNYGTVGTKNEHVISSLNVKSCDGLLLTSPGGISEDDMQYITDHQQELINKIVVVKCSGVSQDVDGNYSVLHPVFKYFRDDKDVANSLAECIEIDKSTTFV